MFFQIIDARLDSLNVTILTHTLTTNLDMGRLVKLQLDKDLESQNTNHLHSRDQDPKS